MLTSVERSFQYDSGEIERGWHGFRLESLPSMLYNGLQESAPGRVGTQNHVGESCLYCCSDEFVTMAAGYRNYTPGPQGLYWSAMWELVVDRAWGKYAVCKPKRKGQWLQRKSGYARRALWIHVMCADDLVDGENIQVAWEPLFECSIE